MVVSWQESLEKAFALLPSLMKDRPRVDASESLRSP